MNTEVEELIGNEESLTKIKLTSGDTISADVCLVGVGGFVNLITSVVSVG